MASLFISGIVGMTIRRHGTVFLFAAVLSVLVTGCIFSGRNELPKKELVMDANYYFDHGMSELKKKNYQAAIENFNTIIESFSGSAVVDSALYFLAESHFDNEDYITAAFEYERVYTDYPASRFCEEAQYKKALSYSMESPRASLDQENTRLAIDEFKRFIENYPLNPLVDTAQKKIDDLNEKLAYKDYLIAELYRKLNSPEGYDAALIYYQSLIEDFPRSTWAWYAQYGIGVIYEKKKDSDKAMQVYTALSKSDQTPSDVKKKAERSLSKLEKNAKK
jgi:outer membrane protein assembly factor BamD